MGPLVERTTLFVTLLHLSNGQSLSKVERAMRKAIKTLPISLTKIVTWDQGGELARHLEFIVVTGGRFGAVIPNHHVTRIEREHQ